MRNIEETEAAKKLLQEKRLMGRPKSELNLPSSYSADYFQRGKDYAEKLRRGCLSTLFFFFLNSLLLPFDNMSASPFIDFLPNWEVLQVSLDSGMLWFVVLTIYSTLL